MHFRRSRAKYFWGTVVLIFVYCEYLQYIMQPLFWQSLECQDPTCTKVLFIADPQIQGDEAVPPPLSYLFNWDSDGYLKITFAVALKSFKPDVLVFLGDLMDEGSISTRQQFHHYVKRLTNIFDVNYPITQVWIPGDNDIGGENEPVRKDKVDEFNLVFNQPTVVTYKNISFYKINAITHTIPVKNDIDNTFKIAISHYPLTTRYSLRSQINSQIHPSIYFCAHEHESKYMKQDINFQKIERHLIKSGDGMLNVQFDNNWIYEIYVPTCSYRMGTNKIGFGAAILDNNNRNMRYTVFWSPKRFPVLCLYLILLIIVILYIFIFSATKLVFRCTERLPRSSDRIPLFDRQHF